MGQIRRYGPSSVQPEVTPAPQLGRASQAVFETIEASFDTVNKFIRPAVEQVQTVRGEQEATAALDGAGPQWALEEVPGQSPTDPGMAPGGAPMASGGVELPKGQGGETKGPAGAPVKPSAARAALRKRGNVAKVYEPGIDATSRAAFEALEAAWGRPLNVNSGYRDPNHNAKVGGAKKSQHIHGKAFDVDVSDLSIEERQALIVQARQSGFGGIGVYANSLHFDTAGERAWGPNYHSDTIPDWAKGALGVSAGTPPSATAAEASYELKTVNGRSFEPRLPFTIRDAAFNSTADKVISARAQEALETGLMLAQQKANGDIKVLRDEMAKVRTEVIDSLPPDLPGLRTDMETAFTRSVGVAERNALALMEKRTIARNTEAMQSQGAAMKAEVERLALTGGSSAEISAALASGQESLAAYGPREGFTLNGKVYGPDPTRAGLISPVDIATSVAGLTADAHRIMIESEFLKSEAPGQFVAEFRKEVFAGNSPLPPGESLALLSELQGRANSAESARRTAANAERERLEKEYKDRINPYVEMTEAGVPVAIPAAERAQIVANLAPYPDLQRQAEIEFAVADAAVATHGMRGGEIVAYAETIRADVAKAAEDGTIDLGAVAVLQSLEDRIKKAQDAVTAEMIGLPMLDQLALDGATADKINWDELRTQAAGNAEVLDKIDVVEAFYRDVESLEGMTADERDSVLEEARAHQAELVMLGKGYGAAALKTTQVIDKLADWSQKRQDLAANDSMAFARAAGVAMPGLDQAQSMGDVGKVLADRVALLAPLTRSEGVKNPVPLDPHEVQAISEIFKGSSRSDQAAFLAVISDMGQDQAQAIFAKIGQSEPVLFAAGAVYAGGNKDAAGVILRGAAEVKVGGGTPEEVSAARAAAIGDLLTNDMINPASVASIDTAAMAYARGVALADGGRAMTQDDLESGYAVAMGQQADGTGGVQYSRYGTTVLPAGWDADRLDDMLSDLDDAALAELVGGTVKDEQMRPYSASQLRRTIEQMRVDPENPNVLVPLDADGGAFLVGEGDSVEILTFDLGKMK